MRSVARWAMVTLLCVGACSTRSSSAPSAAAVALPPGPLAGLLVVRDNAAVPSVSIGRSELDGIAIATLEAGAVTDGTLEVGHFKPSVNLERPGAAIAIAAQATGGPPTALMVAAHIVYSAVSLSRWVVMWIQGRDLIVLTVRPQFARSRSLLRAVLAAAK
jgi:hypothetical protein